MRKVCKKCTIKRNCGFIERGCEKHCTLVTAYQDGYDDAIKAACEWFKKHYREYVPGGADMVEEFIKAMKGGES